jgi:hypothetical protein
MTKIKEILLGIVIAVIFFMFCVFGTKLIYDTPKYEDYCDYAELNKINITTDYPYYDEMYRQCSEEYNLAEKNYSKNMFIISLIFGIIIITICTIFINIGSISGGLMLGSLIFIIYGTGRYWSYMDDLMRFIILGISLGILIYIAYWANKRNNYKNKRKNRI